MTETCCAVWTRNTTVFNNDGLNLIFVSKLSPVSPQKLEALAAGGGGGGGGGGGTYETSSSSGMNPSSTATVVLWIRLD